MNCYRVHEHGCIIGEIIKGDGKSEERYIDYEEKKIRTHNITFAADPNFVKKLNYNEKTVKLLEIKRPKDKQPRRLGLFVFSSIENALKYYTSIRSLYEVEVDDADIYFEADMDLVDKIKIALADDNPKGAEVLADRYWSTPSGVGTIEILVEKAIIIQKFEVKRENGINKLV